MANKGRKLKKRATSGVYVQVRRRSDKKVAGHTVCPLLTATDVLRLVDEANAAKREQRLAPETAAL